MAHGKHDHDVVDRQKTIERNKSCPTEWDDKLPQSRLF